MRKKADQNLDQNQTKFIGPPIHTGYSPGATYPEMELARAYVPIQRLNQLYTPVQALETGTLFPELYRPYPY